MKLRKSLRLMLLLGLATSSLQEASALPTLLFDLGNDGTIEKIVTDDDADGVVTYVGGLDNFEINMSTGMTKPDVGSALMPQLSLDLITSSEGGGLMAIYFSEDLFGPSGQSTVASISGKSDGHVNYSTIAIDEPILTIGSLPPASSSTLTNANLTDHFSVTSLGLISFAPNSLYSLFQKAVITHYDGSDENDTQFTATLSVSKTVPDSGGTLLLFGCSFLGFRVFRGQPAFRQSL